VFRPLLALFATTLVSCGGAVGGDPPVDHGVPSPSGKGASIRDITDPASEQRAVHEQTVDVSGAIVLAVDTYDETSNGRGRGTIYVQDLGSNEAYSGLSLFAPEFVPGNLRVSPGDVLDLRGKYQENQNIGSARFAAGAVLPQLARPIATFRYEAYAPEPVDIDVNDLGSYEKGRRWLNMLVRVKNVTVLDAVSEAGNPRVNARIKLDDPGAAVDAEACDAAFPKVPALTNELVKLDELGIQPNATLKSVVGIVTYFCELHLSPRSLADIEVD